jgi:hypothetical protein
MMYANAGEPTVPSFDDDVKSGQGYYIWSPSSTVTEMPDNCFATNASTLWYEVLLMQSIRRSLTGLEDDLQ